MSLSVLGTETSFWQWDTGRKLVVNNTECGEVHFCNGSGDCTLNVPIVTADDGTRTANVPDVLLQTATPVRVYLFHRDTSGAMTKTAYLFQVRPRVKPADYVYTEPEKQTWEALDERITRIENSETGSTEDLQKQIDQIVSDMNYDPIDITSFTGNLTKAKGETLTERSLSWTINKDPVSQTFDGEALDVSVRSKQLTGLSITSDTKFTLVVTDERGNTDKAESNVYFYNKLYYGVVDDKTAIDADFLKNLSYKVQKSKGMNFTVNPNSQRIIFALPESYSTPSFKDAATGFQADMYCLVDPVEMVHGKYKDNYKVWLSTNILSGSKTITVA